jgi:hypothetical protein
MEASLKMRLRGTDFRIRSKETQVEGRSWELPTGGIENGLRNPTPFRVAFRRAISRFTAILDPSGRASGYLLRGKYQNWRISSPYADPGFPLDVAYLALRWRLCKLT